MWFLMKHLWWGLGEIKLEKGKIYSIEEANKSQFYYNYYNIEFWAKEIKSRLEQL